MKAGKTLSELATELERRRDAKHDLLAQTNAISMVVENSPKADNPENDFERLLKMNVGTEKFSVNNIAHDQIGTWAGIPAKYYDTMLEQEPELLAQNVNTWLHRRVTAQDGSQKPLDKRMVRTLDGTVRAFLSDRYRRIENEDLAEAVLPFLLDQESALQIMSMEVTERRLYIKIVHARVVRELAKTGNHFGDGKHRIVGVVAPAITISNSEVGMGAVSIQVGMYNRFCSNLATMGERSMRKYHAGTRHDLLGDDLSAVLSNETQRLSDAALKSTIKDVVKAAFDEERFDQLVNQVQGTITDEFGKEADPVKVVELASKRLGINEGESKGILQELIKGAELNRFGLHNAITAYSQTVDSYDRATELERIGGQVIELPRSEWELISTAK